MSNPATQRPPTQRLPWPLLGAALTAIVALHFSVVDYGDLFRGLGIIAALILFSAIVPVRLPKGFVIPWAIRAAMFIVIISSVGIPQDTIRGWYFQPQYTNLAGYLLSAEFAFRCWMTRKTDPRTQSEVRGVALLLSALIMTAASDTTQIRMMHIHLLAPLYFIFVALSLRTFGRIVEVPTARPRRFGVFVALRSIALVSALMVAGTSSYAIARYQNRFTSFTMQFIQDRFVPSKGHAIGMGAPKLEKIDNPAPSLGRVAIVEGSLTQRHLRLLAFDTYVPVAAQSKPTSWLPASIPDRSFRRITRSDLSAAIDGSRPVDRLHITMLTDTFDVLLVPLQAAQIESAQEVRRDTLGALQYVQSGTNAPFDVLSPRDPDFQGPICFQPDATERKALLAVPAVIDPRVIALARRVAGDGDPASRVANIVRELWAHHQYSLSFTPRENGDPLNEFILENRDAHCQYFASAAVIMCRAAGVPARFVTGYYLHEPYGDNAMVVRDRDAHAWAECLIDGKWITVDATPATGRPDALFTDVPRWRQRWESVEDIPRLVRQWIANASWKKLAASSLGLIALWVSSSLLGRWRKGRKKSSGFVYVRAAPELLAAATRFERALRQRGIECQPQRPWRENLAAPFQTKSSEPLDRQTCLAFVDAYDAARFGAGNREVLQVLAGLLEKLEKS